MNNPLLYLHLPFCDSKCPYCAFASRAGAQVLMKPYIDALLAQWEHERSLWGITRKSLPTLYIGGGTPSTLPLPLMERLFEAMLPYLALDAEITVEANPSSATRDWLAQMRALGANRLSFGVQSFNADKLAFLGRRHDAAQAKQAVIDAAEAGFAHLSLDLIYATPLDTPALLEAEIAQAAALPVDHLSAYSLTIEEGTPFARRRKKAHPDEEELSTLFVHLARTAGFVPYEISNYARGYISRHNSGYWAGEEYIGLGAGAVGYMAHTRRYPAVEIEAYIANPLALRLETLEESERQTERLFLGLRSYVGVDENDLGARGRPRAQLLVAEGKLFRKEGRLFNPDYLLADELALYLMD